MQTHLLQFGYYQCKHTPGVYRHTTKGTSFTFVIDDFGIKYRSKEDTLHLSSYLREAYEITTNWTVDFTWNIFLFVTIHFKIFLSHVTPTVDYY